MLVSLNSDKQALQTRGQGTEFGLCCSCDINLDYYKESNGIHQQRSEKKRKTLKHRPSIEQGGRQQQVHLPLARHNCSFHYF
jgi:hypothetical protein